MTSSSIEQPGCLAILLEYTEPIQVIIVIFIFGIYPALQYMYSHPLHIFSPSEWRKRILSAGIKFILEAVDKNYSPIKKKILADAKGRVLEVGAGTGQSIKYYDKSKVDVVYGVEPNFGVLPSLREQIAEYEIEDKYQILQCGIEESKKLAESGVYPGSIDTIVCV